MVAGLRPAAAVRPRSRPSRRRCGGREPGIRLVHISPRKTTLTPAAVLVAVDLRPGAGHRLRRRRLRRQLDAGTLRPDAVRALRSRTSASSTGSPAETDVDRLVKRALRDDVFVIGESEIVDLVGARGRWPARSRAPSAVCCWCPANSTATPCSARRSAASSAQTCRRAADSSCSRAGSRKCRWRCRMRDPLRQAHGTAHGEFSPSTPLRGSP